MASAIARAVQELSDGQTRLWPVSLYGTLESLEDTGLIEELDDPRHRPADESEKKRFYRLTRQAGHRALAAETDRLGALVKIARSRLKPRPGGAVVNVYRLLLRLAPRRLRDKHGAEMEAMFRERLADARRARRDAAAAGLVSRGRRHRTGSIPRNASIHMAAARTRRRAARKALDHDRLRFPLRLALAQPPALWIPARDRHARARHRHRPSRCSRSSTACSCGRSRSRSPSVWSTSTRPRRSGTSR